MDFEPWAGQYLHYPWSEGVSITAEGQEPPVGFEPTTARLRIESSTTELRWRPPNLAACCSTRYSTCPTPRSISSSGVEEQPPERIGCRPERRPYASHNQEIAGPAGAGEPCGHYPSIPRQDRVPRHERHTQARGDGLANRLGAPELHRRRKRDPQPREIAFGHAAGARAFLASDVGLARDRGRGHGPAARERVAARDDEHQLVLHPGFRSEPGHEWCFADHSQLQLTHRHRALDLPGIADLESQGDPGIGRMEPPERGRQEVGAGSGAGADREGARSKPTHLARRLLGGAQQREGLARVWLDHARRRSRPC